MRRAAAAEQDEVLLYAGLALVPVVLFVVDAAAGEAVRVTARPTEQQDDETARQAL